MALDVNSLVKVRRIITDENGVTTSGVEEMVPIIELQTALEVNTPIPTLPPVPAEFADLEEAQAYIADLVAALNP